mgnify:CR=1 FL=1
MRVLEDVVSVLVSKGVIRYTDLPDAARRKLDRRAVTRAEIEEIRGVALSRGTLDVLFEAGWIRPRGRRRTPGKEPLTQVTAPVAAEAVDPST